MKYKECWSCCETKPLLEFAKERRNEDGHLHRCKACNKAYRKYLRKDKISNLPVIEWVNTPTFQVTFD